MTLIVKEGVTVDDSALPQPAERANPTRSVADFRRLGCLSGRHGRVAPNNLVARAKDKKRYILSLLCYEVRFYALDLDAIRHPIQDE